jgi:hypothetical protein
MFMILKLYKSSISLRVILLPLLAILISSPILLKKIEKGVYFFSWQNDLFNLISELPFLNFTLSVLVLLLNSILINRVFSRTHFFSKSTFIPALLYVILISYKSNIYFEPVLILHTLLLLLISVLMKIDQNNSAIHIAFKGGLLLGIMCLFSMFYITIIIAVFVALFTMKSFNWREWILVLVGLIVPIIYLFSIQYIYTDKLSFGEVTGMYVMKGQFQLIEYIQIVCFLLSILVSLKSLMKFYNHNTTVTRKRLFITLVLFIITAFMGALSYSLFSNIDFLLIVPVALLLSVSSMNSYSEGLISLLLTITLIVNIVALFLG